MKTSEENNLICDKIKWTINPLAIFTRAGTGLKVVMDFLRLKICIGSIPCPLVIVFGKGYVDSIVGFDCCE